MNSNYFVISISLCLPACINAAPTGWISVKLDFGGFNGKLLGSSKFS